MKLKSLYALALSLCLSTLASSNECIRHCPKAATPSTPSAQPAKNTRTEAAAAIAQEEETTIDSPLPVIRLLYI
jgi:hypothetical protein